MLVYAKCDAPPPAATQNGAPPSQVRAEIDELNDEFARQKATYLSR